MNTLDYGIAKKAGRLLTVGFTVGTPKEPAYFSEM